MKSGRKRSITLVGGPDCAWVIAFADWLLALRVLLHDRDGNLLYKNFDGPDQISAQYTTRESFGRQTFRKTGETYVIRDSRGLLMEQLNLELKYVSVTALSARVQWTEALSTLSVMRLCHV